MPHTITEVTGPRFSPALFPPISDLSVANGKAALGERIIVHGRIADEDGRPIPRTIVEIWQATHPAAIGIRPTSRTRRRIRIFAAKAASTPATKAGIA